MQMHPPILTRRHPILLPERPRKMRRAIEPVRKRNFGERSAPPHRVGQLSSTLLEPPPQDVPRNTLLLPCEQHPQIARRNSKCLSNAARAEIRLSQMRLDIAPSLQPPRVH